VSPLVKIILTVAFAVVVYPVVWIVLHFALAIFGHGVAGDTSKGIAVLVSLALWYKFVFSVKSHGRYASINDVRNAAGTVQGRMQAASEKRSQALSDSVTNRWK